MLRWVTVCRHTGRYLGDHPGQLNLSVVTVYSVPSVLWYCWMGLLTCKNRLPYNLYCVGGDVKHYSVQSNPQYIVLSTKNPLELEGIVTCLVGSQLNKWDKLCRYRSDCLYKILFFFFWWSAALALPYGVARVTACYRWGLWVQRAYCQFIVFGHSRIWGIYGIIVAISTLVGYRDLLILNMLIQSS